jgi:branched-chain amino acid aminotransferase
VTTKTPTFTIISSSYPLPDADRKAALADPGFGRYFTDHMVTIRWTAGQGWHSAQVHPYGPIAMDPANMTLHYGQSVFEGLKAYRQKDGSVALFRPDANGRRFQRSAERLAMPQLPVETFLKACELLVRQDRAWVPSEPEQALYLRPFMIANESTLGARPASEYLFMVLASPAGPYFTDGLEPVAVWIAEHYARAAPGGTGAAKCAGNYAASLLAQADATANGCAQVVWLDSTDHRWIEEVGAMNLCFVRGTAPNAEIVTPELTGTLLPGITRDSLLTLAADLGHTVRERRISVDEWCTGSADGTITEVFGCGTAAVITPVGLAKRTGGSWKTGDGLPGPVTRQLREALLAIQSGQADDRHGWLHPVVT